MANQQPLDQETATQGKRILTAMIENVPQQSEAIGWLISLFLKLLASDDTILALAPLFLSIISNLPKITRELSSQWLVEFVFDVNLRYGTNFSTLVLDQYAWETGAVAVLPLKEAILQDGIPL